MGMRFILPMVFGEQIESCLKFLWLRVMVGGIHDLETRQQVLSVFVSPCRKSTIWSSSSAGRSGFDVTVVVQFEAEALEHWPIARFGTRKSPDASPRALRHAQSGSSRGSGSRYFIRAISSPIPRAGLRWNKLTNDTVLACGRSCISLARSFYRAPEAGSSKKTLAETLSSSLPPTPTFD